MNNLEAKLRDTQLKLEDTNSTLPKRFLRKTIYSSIKILKHESDERGVGLDFLFCIDRSRALVVTCAHYFQKFSELPFKSTKKKKLLQTLREKTYYGATIYAMHDNTGGIARLHLINYSYNYGIALFTTDSRYEHFLDIGAADLTKSKIAIASFGLT
jgi:hypothetical protein